MRLRFFSITLAVLVILAGALMIKVRGMPAAANSPADHLSNIEARVIEQITLQGDSDIIVKFSQRPDLSPAQTMEKVARAAYVYRTLSATAKQSQAEAIAILDGRGLRHQTFIAGNKLYIWGADLEVIEILSGLPGVERITAPRVYPLVDLSQEPASRTPTSALERVASHYLYTTIQAGLPQSLEWPVSDTQADQFWSTYGTQGEGIVVAGIDTGVQWDHPALIESYKCSDNPGDPACWYDPDNQCGGEPCDPFGHGTPVMGMIVGDDDPLLPHGVGLAPGAKWIACLGCPNGSCPEYTLEACADWVLTPGGDPANAPQIVQNSWGGQGCSDWFSDEVNTWLAAGILASFAPGGYGPGCGTMGSPADYPTVFAGTSHDSTRVIASFAARGPSCFTTQAKPNISAPGVNLWVAYPGSTWEYGWSGTSFSSAYGAGGLALVMSCNPGLIGNLEAAFSALQDSADTPPDGYCGAPPDGKGNYTYGHGYMNLLAAGANVCGGQFKGHVFDARDSTPLESAVVTATVSGGGAAFGAKTGADGSYMLPVPGGIYDLTASMSGYYTQTNYTLAITAGQVITQDFYLDAPAIVMTKTVGVDPSNCAETDSLEVLPGTEVTYCYQVKNTGDITLITHDLVDSQLGQLLDGVPITLTPGASAQWMETLPLTSSVVNTATWTAYDGNMFSAQSSDLATVTVLVPGIELFKTVGIDPQICSSTDEVAVWTGSDVTYCYHVFNTGQVTLTSHTLVDDRLGELFSDIELMLPPGEDWYYTKTVPVTVSLINTGTWSATYESGPVVQASDQATVTVWLEAPAIELTKTVGTQAGACALTDSIEVPIDSEVTYCYFITNSGNITLTRHDLTDSQLGVILSDTELMIAPGESISVLVTATITSSVVNTATWTATSILGGFTQASDTATVTVLPQPPRFEVYLPLIFKNSSQ